MAKINVNLNSWSCVPFWDKAWLHALQGEASELCQNINNHRLWPMDGSVRWLPLKDFVSVGFTNTQEGHEDLSLLTLG